MKAPTKLVNGDRSFESLLIFILLFFEFLIDGPFADTASLLLMPVSLLDFETSASGLLIVDCEVVPVSRQLKRTDALVSKGTSSSSSAVSARLAFAREC